MLSISQNGLCPAMLSLPHVVQLDRIDTVHLAYYDWPSNLILTNLRHVTLTNNFISLKTFSSFPYTIRSIHIVLHDYLPGFESCNWSVLRSLSSLPMIKSLRILLNNMINILNDDTCKIIAETIPILVDFVICFRWKRGKRDAHVDFVFNNHQVFIEKLHRRIVLLPLDRMPNILVENGGCGLMAWF
jgi:hypothetical protein